MLAKITSRNPITLPKQLLETLGSVEYFDVQVRQGQIILTPVRIQRADVLRAKLAELGLAEQNIPDADRVIFRGGQKSIATS